MIEKHVIEIRKEMLEKRLQDEEHRKQYVNSFSSKQISIQKLEYLYIYI